MTSYIAVSRTGLSNFNYFGAMPFHKEAESKGKKTGHILFWSKEMFHHWRGSAGHKQALKRKSRNWYPQWHPGTNTSSEIRSFKSRQGARRAFLPNSCYFLLSHTLALRCLSWILQFIYFFLLLPAHFPPCSPTWPVTLLHSQLYSLITCELPR